MFEFSKFPVDDTTFIAQIGKLPPPVTKGLAATLRGYADQLDNIASKTENRIEQRLKSTRHRQKVNKAGFELGALIESGTDHVQAVNRISHKYCIEAAHLRILWPSFKRKIKKKHAIERARAVMTGYRAGLSNADIAAKNAITDRQVRRIIADELAAYSQL